MTRFLLFLAVALAAPASPAAAQEAPRPVKLMTVEAPSGEVTRRFFGKAAARQTVDLAFRTGGQIVRFPAVEGEIVPAGKTIAQLDREPFRLALSRARLQSEKAERRAGRLRALAGAGTSRESVENAATEAGLARIAVRKAERELGHATLTAPFDALVASRKVARFTTVAAGRPVVRLHDMSELRIEIDVPEILFQRAGRDPDVSIVARFPGSGKSYPVEVREHDAETSRIGQTFRVTFGMAPPGDLTVLPGSSAAILVTLKGEDRRMAIPASAVVIAPDRSTSVMVFRAGEGDEGVVASQPVTLAAGRDGDFRVVDGLGAGAEIVAAGAGALRDGQRVRRFRGFPD